VAVPRRWPAGGQDTAAEVAGPNADQADVARLCRLAEAEQCLATTET